MFLKGYTFAMLTYYVKKIAITYLPMIMLLFGAITIETSDKQLLTRQSTSAGECYKPVPASFRAKSTKHD